jgi:PAP2 superfamily
MKGSNAMSGFQSQSESESESEELGLAVGAISLSGQPMLQRPTGLSPSGGERPFVGQNWPPALEAHKWKNAPPPPPGKDAFERLFGAGSPWTADFYPTVILTEFLQRYPNEWWAIKLPEKEENANLEEELKELVEIMNYRPGMISEVLAQANGILDYFRGIFSFSAKSHPKTYALGATAIRVGEFQVMYYKARYNRPRPSRLSPRLMPLIEVPGHASFPSGHATQAMLVALLLTQVMPEPAAKDKDPLLCLANRIARNREVMGLHYRSDTLAGQYLAEKTCDLLSGCDTVATLLREAKQEWGRQG